MCSSPRQGDYPHLVYLWQDENYEGEHCVRNALGLIALAGEKNIPVACGREMPLTNVAETLAATPSLTSKLEMIYIMGGALNVPGNVGASGVEIDNAVAEWNIYVDPHAANIVVKSGAPIMLVPLDATNRVPVTAQFYERLRSQHTSPDWQVAASAPAVFPLVGTLTYARYVLVLRYLAVVVFFIVAVVIAWRKSNDWMALLSSVMLLALPVGSNLGGYTETWAVYSATWREPLRLMRDAVSMTGGLLFVLLAFLFPDGRFAPRWMRWVIVLPMAMTGLVSIANFVGESAISQPLRDLHWLARISAVIAILYMLIVGGLSAVFQSSGDLLIAIIATGLIAALFNPLRIQVQRVVNRALYGERDDPVAVLSRLGQQLETAIVPDAALKSIVDTVAQALKLPYAEIALKEGDEYKTVAVFDRVAGMGRSPCH